MFKESYEYLKKKGVDVVKGVLTKEAAEVLKEYG